MYNLVIDIDEDGNVYGIHASFDTKEAAQQRVDRERENASSKLISAILEDAETDQKIRLF